MSEHNPRVAEPVPRGEFGKAPNYFVTHPKACASGLLVVVVLAFVASATSEVVPNLPTAALGWKFGLDLIRALVVVAIIGGIAMVLIRGRAGEWPKALGPGGAEYADRPEVAKAVENYGEAQARLDPVVDSVVSIIENATMRARTGDQSGREGACAVTSPNVAVESNPVSGGSTNPVGATEQARAPEESTVPLERVLELERELREAQRKIDEGQARLERLLAGRNGH